MKKAKYTWVLSETSEPTVQFEQIAQSQQLSSLATKLLWSRGINDEVSLTKFLNPQIEDLFAPNELLNLDCAVQRINQAITEQEKILIYGDYDADGITATSLLKEALERTGAQVITYIPNRFTDGYGPNLDRYRYFIEEEAVNLIITVDNGVSGIEPVAYANQSGVDVIITDHHDLPETLPEAVAIVHPQLQNSPDQFSDLAGVGVAFKLACALLGEVHAELLDLVAIGTVADLVSLTNENRTLVALGLQVIKQGERLGLLELISQANLDLDNFNEEDISFAIAPRINAVGRLGDANLVVDLLTTSAIDTADDLAQKVEAINEQRKALTKDVEQKAYVQLADQKDSPVNIVADTDFHEGVLGIVASTLVRETGKPSFVFNLRDDGVAKGSARSVANFDLFATLNQEQDLFLSFGGHPQAAGMSLEASDLPKLRLVLEQALANVDLSLAQNLAIDQVLAVSEITVDTVLELQKFAPFGINQPKFKFLINNPVILSAKAIGQDQKHLKLLFGDNENENKIDALFWQHGQLADEFNLQTKANFVGTLAINEWNGVKKPQIMLEDLEINGQQIFDFRGRSGINRLPAEESLFLVNQEKHLKLIEEHNLPLENCFSENQTEEIATWLQLYPDASLVIFDLVSRSFLAKLMTEYNFTRIFLVVLSDEAYLDGIGSHEQFVRAFNFFRKNKTVSIHQDYQKIAKMLHLPTRLLIFIVQVFAELGFVTIDAGKLTIVEHPTPHNLKTSTIYQKREQEIEEEMFFLLSDRTVLQQWFAEVGAGQKTNLS